MAGVLIRTEIQRETDTQVKGTPPLKVKAETGAMLPLAKGCQAFLATTWSKQKVKRGSSLEPLGAE